MPELPEVETVMRGLAQAMTGRQISRLETRRDGLRFKFPKDMASRMEGRRVEGLTRRAKYIVVRMEGGQCLLIHLGMTGRFTVARTSGQLHNLGEFYFEQGSDAAGSGPHDHAVFTLDDGTRLIYSDPRRFGVLDLFAESEIDDHRLLRNIGVEPLSNGFHAQYLAEAFAGKKAPLKACLLDQRIIAGLGNIYACEALYRSGLAPRRKARTLVKRGKPDPRLERLAANIRSVLSEAIAAGGSTLRDYVQTDGSQGAFQERFSVYDREGLSCRTPCCGGTVRRIVQAGRSTFFCPQCQK